MALATDQDVRATQEGHHPRINRGNITAECHQTSPACRDTRLWRCTPLRDRTCQSAANIPAKAFTCVSLLPLDPGICQLLCILGERKVFTSYCVCFSEVCFRCQTNSKRQDLFAGKENHCQSRAALEKRVAEWKSKYTSCQCHTTIVSSSAPF